MLSPKPKRFSRKRKILWGLGISLLGIILITVLNRPLFTLNTLGLFQALGTATYYLNVRRYSDKSPEFQRVLQKLAPLHERNYFSLDELAEAVETQLGATDFTTYGKQVLRRYRTRGPCFEDPSATLIHTPHSSVGHPLYASFYAEPLPVDESFPEVPTKIRFVPGSTDLLILGQHGTLTRYNADLQRRWQIQIPDVFHGRGDQGSLGMAFHPEYLRNRYLFVSFVNEEGKQNVIQRMTVSDDPQAMQASRVDILRVSKDDSYPVHGIAGLEFDAKGQLWVAIGSPRSDEVQLRRSTQGKVLRVIPSLEEAQGGYTKAERSWPERWHSLYTHLFRPIYALGFRAPFQTTYWNDKLIVGDVGSDGPNSFERINVVDAYGQNFGFPLCQDPHLSGTYSKPIIAYRRDDAGVSADIPSRPSLPSRSVMLGPVYEKGDGPDPYRSALEGRLLYGDVFLRFIRGARLSPEDARVEDDVLLLESPVLPTSMAQGPDGYIYLVGIGEKRLFRLRLKQPPEAAPRSS